MQLVELQRSIVDSGNGEPAVAALSYDTYEVLSGFAKQNSITYPLLGDVGSVEIERLGLLNTQIVEERAFWGKPVEERHKRVPYPGTFILDADGVITEKMFERSHRIRPGGKVLLDRLGLDAPAPERVANAEAPGLSVAAWVDEFEYYPNQLNRLHLRMAVADEHHIYVPPNPAGFTNLEIQLSGSDGLFTHEPSLPAGHDFSVEGFDESFVVAEGELQASVPFYLLEDLERVTLHVAIAYQACTESTCLMPDRVELSLDLTEVRA
jgi:peroxiredoxin